MDKFDKNYDKMPVMYESQESRYPTELVNVPAAKVVVAAPKVTCDFAGYEMGVQGTEFYVVDSTGARKTLAMRNDRDQWLCGSAFVERKGFEDGVIKAEHAVVGGKDEFTITMNGTAISFEELSFGAVARFNAEADLKGDDLGEVELQINTYAFKPRTISLGVTWTQLAELVLDTSFGVSAEEMLMDSAAQEIKKSLDFQAVKYARDCQKIGGADNFVQFNAEAGGDTKDSYYHTAQLIGQAIDRIGDKMLNAFNRGGVSAIVGGPAAINYLKLNKAWSDKGKQPAIGGHKVGELDGKIWDAVVKVA